MTCAHTVKTHKQHLWRSCRQHRMQDRGRRWCHGRWSGDLWMESGQLSKGEVGDINAPEDRTDKGPRWGELHADGSLENGYDCSARWQKWLIVGSSFCPSDCWWTAYPLLSPGFADMDGIFLSPRVKHKSFTFPFLKTKDLDFLGLVQSFLPKWWANRDLEEAAYKKIHILQ